MRTGRGDTQPSPDLITRRIVPLDPYLGTDRSRGSIAVNHKGQSGWHSHRWEILTTPLGGRAVARVGVDRGQDTQLLAGRELVVNEVHSPDVVQPDSLLAIISELCLYPTLLMFVAQLQA
jgi:hypothetical protein